MRVCVRVNSVDERDSNSVIKNYINSPKLISIISSKIIRYLNMKNHIFSATTATLGLLVACVGFQLIQAKLAIDTFSLIPYESYQCARDTQGYEGAAIGCYKVGTMK